MGTDAMQTWFSSSLQDPAQPENAKKRVYLLCTAGGTRPLFRPDCVILGPAQVDLVCVVSRSVMGWFGCSTKTLRKH